MANLRLLLLALAAAAGETPANKPACPEGERARKAVARAVAQCDPETRKVVEDALKQDPRITSCRAGQARGKQLQAAPRAHDWDAWAAQQRARIGRLCARHELPQDTVPAAKPAAPASRSPGPSMGNISPVDKVLGPVLLTAHNAKDGFFTPLGKATDADIYSNDRNGFAVGHVAAIGLGLEDVANAPAAVNGVRAMAQGAANFVENAPAAINNLRTAWTGAIETLGRAVFGGAQAERAALETFPALSQAAQQTLGGIANLHRAEQAKTLASVTPEFLEAGGKTYKVLSPLGEGAEGRVFLTQADDARQVALKTFFSADGAARNADALRKLASQGFPVPRVYGRHGSVVELEYVAGVPMRYFRRLNPYEKMPAEELGVSRELIEEIVRRWDALPLGPMRQWHNVIVRPDGRFVLIDPW